MFSSFKDGFFSSKKTYSTNVIITKAELSVATTESYQVQQSSTPETFHVSDNETFSFAEEEKLPVYKEIVEFALSAYSGYMLMIAFGYVTGMESPSNEVLATMLTTAAPYFNSRFFQEVMTAWLTNPTSHLEDYKKAGKRGLCFLGTCAVGAALGSISLFKDHSLKESAFLGALGMVTGKALELSITAYEEKKVCCKKENITLSPRN